MILNKEYILKQKQIYTSKLQESKTVEEMENSWWWLEYINNFNWIK